jgi:hypothetical protein
MVATRQRSTKQPLRSEPPWEPRSDLTQATVFGWNPASGRVLEKCGFRLEGRLSSGIIKGGDFTDELIYGLVPPRANHEPTQNNRSRAISHISQSAPDRHLGARPCRPAGRVT